MLYCIHKLSDLYETASWKRAAQAMTKKNARLYEILTSAQLYTTPGGRKIIVTGKYTGHTFVVTSNGGRIQ